MSLRRTLRGRPIRRMRRRGNDILVLFRSEARGSPGLRLVLPLAEYQAELRQAADPSAP